MRLGVVAKSDEPHRAKIATYVYDYLKGRADVVAQPGLAKHFGEDVKAVRIEDMDVDAIVTVGGDGTILHTMQRNAAPVFGINLGEIGFLAEAEPIELPDALDRLLAGDYYVEERLKLETRLNGKRLPDALNETVIKTTRASKMLAFRIAIADHEVQRVRADGLMVSTPTGSTSYSMSAGGPIMDPRLSALVLVPIAAFSLSSRPIVVPAETELQVRLMDSAKDAVLVMDGQEERPVHDDDVVTFRGADERARFIRFRSTFYERLQERLGPG